MVWRANGTKNKWYSNWDVRITIREKNNLEMLLDKKDNTYNADKTFDYFTIKSMIIQSLKIVREGLNRHIASINLYKINNYNVYV